MFLSLITYAVVQTPTITLDVKGTRLPNLEPILSKEFGEPVYTPTYMKNVALTIRVKDVTPAELRQKIALVLNAGWDHDSGGWRLAQSGTQKRDEEQLAQKIRFEKVSKMLARAKKKVAEMQPFTKEEARKLARELEALGSLTIKDNDQSSQKIWSRIQRVDSMGPYSRFAARLATRLTPQMLMAATEDNPRVVYANKPTDMQYAVPVKVDDLYSDLIAEQNTWSDVANGKNFNGPKSSGGGMFGIGASATQTQPMDSYPKTSLISVTYGNGDAFSVMLKLYDEKGKNIVSQSIANTYEELTEEMMAAEAPTDAAQDKFEYSPEADELKNRFGERKKAGPLSQGLREKLLQPEKFDATGFGLTEKFWAMAKGKNVVAVLPSSMAAWDNFAINNPYTKLVWDIKQDEKWCTGTPTDPVTFRKHELDRSILGKLIRISQKANYLSIDDQAAFVYALPWNQDRQYEYQMWVNVVTEAPESYSDSSALRIWATLPEKLKKVVPVVSSEGPAAQVVVGGRNTNKKKPRTTVAFGELPAETQLEIRRAIFGNRSDYNYLQMDYEDLIGPNGEWGPEMNEIQEQVYGGLLSELTHTFGKGIPSSAPLEVKITESKSMAIGGEEGSAYGGTRFFDPYQMGQNAFQRENLQKYPYADNDYYKVDMNSIKLVVQKNVAINLVVKKGVLKSWNITENRPLDSNIYTKDTLPGEFKEKYQKGYKDAKENDKRFQGYSGFERRTNQNIPPAIR